MNRRTFIAAVLAAATLASPAVAALQPGTTAPNFRVPAFLAGKPFTFKLNDALKKGPVVVYFFPAAFTAGCNIEARMFSVAIDDFKKAGASVIGVTAGNIDRLAEFSASSEHCSGKFPVAADPGAKIAKQYDATLALKPGWSNRTSYVIRQDGKVVLAYSNLDPREHVKQTLDAVRALTGKSVPATTAKAATTP